LELTTPGSFQGCRVHLKKVIYIIAIGECLLQGVQLRRGASKKSVNQAG